MGGYCVFAVWKGEYPAIAEVSSYLRMNLIIEAKPEQALLPYLHKIGPTELIFDIAAEFLVDVVGVFVAPPGAISTATAPVSKFEPVITMV